MPPLILGNEALLRDRLDLIRGRRVGLVANPTGLNRRLEPTADLLHARGDVRLVALFGPEHGIRGDAPDGAPVGPSVDEATGVPVHSLYGETLKPTPEMLEGVEVLLCDLQDVGVRFYTYLYTMAYAMEAAGEAGIPFVVLDRPNPIGGVTLEGNVLDPAFRSFVGGYPIALRYGMTIGEVARLFHGAFGVRADLTVVPLSGWRRDATFDATGLPWVPPSPNMPTLEAALVYPGICLFEGTNVSEGRGTAKPFEQIGAPYLDGRELSRRMNAKTLPGAIFRPVAFTPSAGKWAGQPCRGLQVHVLDRSTFRPLRIALEIIAEIRTLHPGAFAWRPHFDLLLGTDRVRLALEAGEPVEAIVASWSKEIAAFQRLRERYLIYGVSG